MSRDRFAKLAVLAFVAVAISAPVFAAPAQPAAQAPGPEGVSYEAVVAPGNNFDKAEFKLWLPSASTAVRAVVVLVPGSNGDGRPSTDDPVWREFAVRRGLALLGCRFTDKPHEQSFIEEYANVALGSGQALLDALTDLAVRSRHPELAGAPLLLWGMSAGGQYNYEFTAWKPERVAAFIVNKGGIYYSALVPKAAREVPGILFTGEKDMAFRSNTIAGLFAVNRRAGALWAFVEEPGAAHIVGRSRDLALIFFDDVLTLRLGTAASGSSGSKGMSALSDKTGFIGNPETKSLVPAGQTPAPNRPTSWLPTERVARTWQAVLTGKPFEN